MLALALMAVLSCTKSDSDATEWERGSCNPVDPALCALPYPSSFYLKTAETPTGFQVDYAADSLPLNRDGVQVVPTYWNEKDGFSTMGPFMTYFADLSLDGVVGHNNIADYAAADAKIILLDTVTGQRVPAWAEVDMTAEDPGQRLLQIWPDTALEFDRTYIVAVRGTTTNAGAAVAPSAAFAALRDGTATEDGGIEIQRAHYDEEIFPKLETAGIARADLQIAWDFHTVSRQTSLGRMEFIRDDGLPRVDAGLTYTIKSVVDHSTEGDTDHDCDAGAQIARDILVRVDIPNYMEDPTPNHMLTRDDAGMPFYNGTMESTYLVRIPCSIAEDPKPSYVLSYGHGLLGNKDEAYTGWLSEFANKNGWIIIAHDWLGMSGEDYAAIALTMVNDPGRFAIIPERSHQGFFSAMAGLRFLNEQLLNDDVMKFADANGTMVSVVDPERHGYYGISQGGIMGGALLTMSPDLDRGVLGVPGSPYSMLLSRSRDFDPFFDILKAKFPDHRDTTMLIGMFEALWEPAESGGWLWSLHRDVQPGYEGKRVLLQDAIGDAQVTTLGAHFMARAYGAKTITPVARELWGIESTTAPYEGNGLVEFLYSDAPPALSEPETNIPPRDTPDPHECQRREPAGQEQIKIFLETGVIEQTCDGICGSSVAETCN